MSTIKRAVLFSVLTQHSVQFISIISTAILARLLSPEETGLFAVATSIAFLATELRTFGASEYIIREKDMSTPKIRSVLGVMIIMSWGIAFGLISGGSWFADFYGKPELCYLIWIVSLPFFFAPYCSIPYSLLMRDLDFSTTMKINVLGTLARNLGSITLVSAGYSYYGLAWGTFIGVLVEFLAITYFRPKAMPWLPAFNGLKHVFRAGIQITLGRFLVTTSQNSNDLILGRMATMSDVGYFSRGMGVITLLQSLLTNAANPVALPHLSRVKHTGGDVAQAYIQAVSLVGAITLPVFAVVNLAAPYMVRALFGDQWGSSGHAAAILAIWAMLQSVHCFAIHALLSVSKERIFLIKETISLAIKAALMVLSIPYGLEYVAWGFVITGIFDFAFISLLLRAAIRLSISKLLVAFLPNAIVAVSCWGTLKIMCIYIDLDAMNHWLAIGLIGVAMVPVWLITLKLSGNKAWGIMQDILTKIRQRLQPSHLT